MIVNLKIYKFSDPDMYALHNAGISVPALMKLAIAYRARGRRLHIFIPDCLYCDLSGQKRHIPLKITTATFPGRKGTYRSRSRSRTKCL